MSGVGREPVTTFEKANTAKMMPLMKSPNRIHGRRAAGPVRMKNWISAHVKMSPTISSTMPVKMYAESPRAVPQPILSSVFSNGFMSPLAANFTPIWVPAMSLANPLASQKNIQKMTVPSSSDPTLPM